MESASVTIPITVTIVRNCGARMTVVETANAEATDPVSVISDIQANSVQKAVDDQLQTPFLS